VHGTIGKNQLKLQTLTENDHNVRFLKYRCHRYIDMRYHRYFAIEISVSYWFKKDDPSLLVILSNWIVPILFVYLSDRIWSVVSIQ